MRPDGVSDRLAIGEVMSAYAFALDTKDWDALMALFVPDARIDYSSFGGPTGTPADVVGWLQTSLAAFDVCQHVITNHRITLDGDSASAHSYVVNPLGSGGDVQLLGGGSYLDTFARTPDGWRFTSKVAEKGWLKAI